MQNGTSSNRSNLAKVLVRLLVGSVPTTVSHQSRRPGNAFTGSSSWICSLLSKEDLPKDEQIMCVFQGWNDHEPKEDPLTGVLLLLLVVLFLIFCLPLSTLLHEIAGLLP